MTQKDFIESKLSEFDKVSKNIFEVLDELIANLYQVDKSVPLSIGAKRKEEIKSFLSIALKEIVEELEVEFKKKYDGYCYKEHIDEVFTKFKS